MNENLKFEQRFPLLEKLRLEHGYPMGSWPLAEYFVGNLKALVQGSYLEGIFTTLKIYYEDTTCFEGLDIFPYIDDWIGTFDIGDSRPNPANNLRKFDWEFQKFLQTGWKGAGLTVELASEVIRYLLWLRMNVPNGLKYDVRLAISKWILLSRVLVHGRDDVKLHLTPHKLDRMDLFW